MTRLSCLVRVGGVNTIGDRTKQFCLVSTQFPIYKFSVVLNIFETKKLQIGNANKMMNKHCVGEFNRHRRIYCRRLYSRVRL